CAVRRRNRRDGADRRLRPTATGGDGQGGVRRGGELFRSPTGIPPIHPPPDVRGPANPGNPDFRRPRQGGSLAQGRGRGADPCPPTGSMGDPAKGRKKHDRRVTKRLPCRIGARNSASDGRIKREPPPPGWLGAPPMEISMNLIQQLEKEQFDKL